VRKIIRQAASLGQILLAIIERLPLWRGFSKSIEQMDWQLEQEHVAGVEVFQN